jgi:CDGSH iron-sulfur domain-containing protein 3
MTDPVVTQPFPYFAEVEEGKSYHWCACGLSSSQPFCDGSHKSTDITPVEYTATNTKKIAFCGCKHSKRGAICDGNHNNL